MFELNFRRRSWTNGLPVLLTGGSAWYFPRIDFVLMAATSGLQVQMAEVFRLARENQHETDETKNNFKTALYHTRMSMLGIALLRINYDATDIEWARLTDFSSLREMISFSEQTSWIFFETSEIWMPFLATCGPENREVLALN